MPETVLDALNASDEPLRNEECREIRALRWEEAPALLELSEAAYLLRIGYRTFCEQLSRQRHLRTHGNHPHPNPIPVLTIGGRRVIPSELLREWVKRETERLAEEP